MRSHKSIVFTVILMIAGLLTAMGSSAQTGLVRLVEEPTTLFYAEDNTLNSISTAGTLQSGVYTGDANDLVIDTTYDPINNQLFYSSLNNSFGETTIYRSNTDGTANTSLYTTPDDVSVTGIDFDYIEERLYFVENDSRTPDASVARVLSMNTDGTDVSVVYNGPSPTATAETIILGIAVEPLQNRLLMTVHSQNTSTSDITPSIIATDLDGNNVQTLLGPLDGLSGIIYRVESDPDNGLIFLASVEAGIQYANSDGSGFATLTLSEPYNTGAIAIDPVNEQLYFSKYPEMGDLTLSRVNYDGTGEVVITSLTGDTLGITSNYVPVIPQGNPPRIYPEDGGTLTDATEYSPNFVFQQVEGVEWYNVWVGDVNDATNPLIYEWYPATDASQGAQAGQGICEAGICTIPDDVWAANGDYQWWMTYWGPQLQDVNSYWDGTEFSIQYPTPGMVTRNAPNAPYDTLTWVRDPNVLWYQFWVGTADYETEVLYEAYQANEVCAATTCTVVLDEALPSGDYEWWGIAWGSGGYIDWTTNGAFAFTVP